MENTIVTVRDIVWTVFPILLCIFIAVLIIKLCLSFKNDAGFKRKYGVKLYDLAFKDTLTGLYNRNAYRENIQKLENGKQESLWILLFDIDDLKAVNDANGHLFGDEILIAAAACLRHIFDAPCHTVFRIGGDEFLVLSKGLREEQIVDLLLQLKEAESHGGKFRFSKGYARVDQSTKDNAFRDAFFQADQMLYADKQSKKPVL